LQEQGHTPVELERGSMSFKIWKTIKIKRIRVPDVFCVACGRRFESRAKTNLQISMSHSFSNQERGWDYGLDDNDFVALVACRRVGDGPVDWEADRLVQYIAVRDLRTAQRDGMTISVRPKGAQEGFEARITWPASIARADGIVSSVNKEKLQYRRQVDNRAVTLRLSKQGFILVPLVRRGDAVTANQIIASVVPIHQRLGCPKKVTEQEYAEQLSSPSLSERYKASKALSSFGSPDSAKALANKIADEREHIYVRLEAAASLARRQDRRGVAFIENCLNDQYLENRLEAVIVLGEVGSQSASRVLVETLSNVEQHPEIRAGAAWALGELQEASAIDALIQSFKSMEEEIQVEAARALAKFSEGFTAEMIDTLPRSDELQRAGLAWALSKSARFTVEQLLQALVDDNARRRIAYIIGTQDPEKYIGQIEILRQEDPEIYFAITALWQIMNSWIYGLEEHG
jgi:hypothetical protein